MDKKHLPEFKSRAVWMVADCLDDDQSCTQWRAFNDIAQGLGISVESMRRWYEQSWIDTDQRSELMRE